MTYVVLAGYVSAETQVQGRSRAVIDIPRGAVLPDDVPAEQVQAFLVRGWIELEVPDLGEPDTEPDEELDGLDKELLLEIALHEKVQVDKRWGADRIAAAIKENRQ